MMVKQKIIQCFNSGAKNYDMAADIQITAAKELLNYLTIPADRILEIGSGTGQFSQLLIEKFPSATILLTDIAPEMIRILQNKFPSCHNVDVVCMDGENLAVQPSYDLIVSNMTLHWFADLVDSIKKIINRLKPGGRFIFTLLAENSLREWREVYPHTLTFPKLELLKNQFPTMEISVKNYSQRYSNAHHFLKTLKQIGGTATDAILSSGKLRSILRRLDLPFDVTYEIIYGKYIKT